MRNVKRILAVVLTGVLTFTLIACGAASNSAIDDQAAVRGLDEGAGEIWIDDEAIALAGTAASSQAAVDACTAVFNLMNQQRAARGLATLTWSDALTSAAQVRANEIVTVFSHTRPNGSAFWTVDSNVQYGENLAKLYQSADSVYTAWMNSPTHAANIMDAGYKTVGIAVCQTGDGSWYWAQEFGY
ncbi:CAP domain-containing protein [Butyrivibrio sp. FCS014]|uniref:CAP domain-containing protein n=1 Tax=Butyrivibrio sp. FCS014 TaxID=1408304 RepID=UPI000466BC28|nr:CAP domain-containing protein [Butyrivibrio sp. FCS014]